MSKKRKEYSLEQSPFYSLGTKLRATLTELKASSGEDLVLARKRYFKQDEYVKFIVDKEFDIVSYHKLSSIAKTILQYIVYNCLEYNSPTFRFKVSQFAFVIDCDTSYIHKGIKELSASKYIAKTTSKEIYWINHNKYYKGNFMIDRYIKEK